MGIAGLDNIGNTYGAYNYTNKVANNSRNKSFAETVGNVTEMPSANLTLHISHEGDEEKSVSAWSDANAGRNVTVYQPKDFDPSNPMYRMKIWDENDNLLEERMVDLRNIDPSKADSYDMFALSAYGEKSGECPDAISRFTMMHAKQEIEQRAQYGTYSLDTVENWMDILKNFMKEQYEVGNLQGYMNAKQYYEFLSDF